MYIWVYGGNYNVPGMYIPPFEIMAPMHPLLPASSSNTDTEFINAVAAG